MNKGKVKQKLMTLYLELAETADALTNKYATTRLYAKAQGVLISMHELKLISERDARRMLRELERECPNALKAKVRYTRKSGKIKAN